MPENNYRSRGISIIGGSQTAHPTPSLNNYQLSSVSVGVSSESSKGVSSGASQHGS